MNVGVMAGTHTQTELRCSFSPHFCFWMSVKREAAGAYRLQKLQNNFSENIPAEYEATRVNKRDTVTVGNLEERQSGLTHIIPP